MRVDREVEAGTFEISMRGELLFGQNLLPDQSDQPNYLDQKLPLEGIPNVEVLQGQSMVANFIDREENKRTLVHRGDKWIGGFLPGDQLQGVSVGTGRAEVDRLGTVDGDLLENLETDDIWLARMHDYSCGGHVNGHPFGEGDVLVVRKEDSQGAKNAEILFHPAEKPLPGVHDEVTYQLLGYVNPAQTLVGLGYAGQYARGRVDYSLAAQLADTHTDVRKVERALGTDGPWRTLALSDDKGLAEAYLRYWSDKFGKNHDHLTWMSIGVQELRGMVDGSIDPRAVEMAKRALHA